MLTDEIIERLYTMQDKKFGEFQSRLCPTLNADRFIGVRTPELRKYAKELQKRDDIGEFLSHVPHTYFD